ncbi:glycoside hydrolase family 3 C-terminal domain-containing protein [Reichenbachiella carrageenanivorans]|uniref:beta-glucosidase n=1 Tax=Reichenbachiella carrageenanivorans TaxID=2979869 RepID=A0ABY6D5A3_9BACT|nr:glycoside hydrolase family 3 N-terminal domain-containing protein [Reichenbachiella carrageenanivorans]UXX81278.1 glycoside hydrolase family 3 C-terminal domain-containing protein [Reichenbachiella carrageenanivorans]
MKPFIKKHLFSILAIGICYACTPMPDSSSSKDQQVLDLMRQMTLEQKVGQMTQITLGKFHENGKLDTKALRHAIIEKNVGSILNTNGSPLSVAQWHELLTTIQDIATKETPLQIPILYGIDAIHGTSYTQGSTLFPHNIGMGATRNTDLVSASTKITAMEVRASGIRWNFDPTLGIGRQPLWSRFEETFGEDVYLTSLMGGRAINAYEEDGLKNITAVASCMKHFIGYSVPLSGKDRTPAYIPDIQMREYFLPPFEAAVANGTSTVMINSGEVNGIPVHASKYYLQDILRGELGFEGLAVSDWEDIIRLHIRHQIAATPKEAVKIAVNAGIDMSMVPMDYSFYDYLIELVNEGEVSQTRIDEAVYRILKLKFDLGLFDNAYPEPAATANFGKPDYAEVALNAALESITLLKNENQILPLGKDTKILLTGPGAHNIGALHGSWSYTWQGDNEAAYHTSTLTLKDAMVAKIGEDQVISNATANYLDAENTNTAFVRNNANKVDVIVLAIGEKAYAESPGGIDDLTLASDQLALVEAAIATGKPVVLLLAQGRPRVISSVEPGVKGIMHLYRPASQGAKATMEILFGDYNPNGKLPFTYPKNTGDVILYDRKNSENFKESEPDTYGLGGFSPQWSFGHGLSYTTFAYSDLKLDKTTLAGEDSIHISVNVSNTGDRDGLVAVELYVSDLYASVTPSEKRLKRFKKVEIKQGNHTQVEFQLAKNDLSFINQNSQRITEEGEFTVMIGDQKENFFYQK